MEFFFAFLFFVRLSRIVPYRWETTAESDGGGVSSVRWVVLTHPMTDPPVTGDDRVQ